MALRAIVSNSKLHAIVDTDSLEPVTVFADIQSLVHFRRLNYDLDFTALNAVDIVTDADSKNLFFTPLYRADKVQNITITESLANAISKTGIADGVTVFEVPALSTSKPASDTLSISEVIEVLKVFERAFSDTTSVAENYTPNFGKNPSDSSNVADTAPALTTGLAKSDTSSISESSDVVRNKTFGTPYALTTTPSPNQPVVTYTVTVAAKSSGSGNAFYIDGMEQLNFNMEVSNYDPALPSTGNRRSVLYRWDLSDSSLTGHPFKLSLYDDGKHNAAFSGGATHYPFDDGDGSVTYTGTPGSAGAKLEYNLWGGTWFPSFSPLYYYCDNHSGMGGRIDIQGPMNVRVGDFGNIVKVVSFARTFTDTTSLDDTASASDDLATESGINKNNVVSVAESLGPFAVSKPLTDTATVTENISINGANQFVETANVTDSPSIGFAPATVANSVSVSESINVQLFVGGTEGALLNKSALNTYSINS